MRKHIALALALEVLILALIVTRITRTPLGWGLSIPVVIAQNLFQQTCAAGLVPITGPSWQTYNSVNGQYLQWGCIDSLGNLNIAGITYISVSSTQDFGTTLNTAYSNCPGTAASPAVCRMALVNQKTINFSTPITFTTKGKYYLLESLNPCVLTISASFGGCLNYTPTTATVAITLDVYDTAVTNEPIQYGLKNIGLLNNNCTQTGGCASLATGILVGTTNGGNMDSIMDNVSILGFSVGYQNVNANATDVHWKDEFFQANGVANKIGTLQDWRTGGKYIGNGQALLAPAGTTPELHWTNPDFVGNSVLPVLDFTVAGGAGNPAHYFSVNGHYENGNSTSADLQYISGNVDMYFAGGTMGNDSSSGTGSWYISCSGTNLSFSSVEFQSGRPVTQAVLMNSPCRAAGTVGNFSPTNITTFFSGANAANTSVLISTGNTANAQAIYAIEGAVTVGTRGGVSGTLECSTTSTCAKTVITSPITVKGGPILLSTGTLTITSLPFTSSTSYVCSPDDSTGINGIDVVYNSGSSVTFNGTGTDSIRYSCIGN